MTRTVQELEEENKALREQNNNLLDALMGLLREFNQHVPENTNCPDVRKVADAARIAIRKAEEQS